MEYIRDYISNGGPASTFIERLPTQDSWLSISESRLSSKDQSAAFQNLNP